MAGEDETTNMERTINNERPKKMKDYLTLISSIVRTPVEANNFELQPAMITMIQNMVQFFDLPHDDPNQHIVNFLETFKMNGVSSDAIQLRLFSFSLRDKAKAWVQSLPVGAYTPWDELSKAFIYKYFPPSRSAKLENEILGFQ